MMKLRYIEEPSLQFGIDQHICPKSGVYSFYPYDIRNVRPEKIKVGIIGKGESIDKVINWLDSCKSHIKGKESKIPHPNLFLNFCGFNKEMGFKSEIIFDDSYLRRLNNSDFDKIIKSNKDFEKRIKEIAGLYLSEIKYLSKNKNPDVIICALSEKFISYILSDSKTADDDEEGLSDTLEDDESSDKIEREQNFRRYLKAKAMQFNVPIQILRDRIANPTSDMQDPATIAWNFFTALYYKASGTPWALIRKDSAEATCYAGISFYRSRDRKRIQTSIAQIFNELGRGVILRGEEILMNKYDLTPHLTEEQSYNLLSQSLKEYYDAVKIFPKRLVLHKTSNYNEDEISGFNEASKTYKINQVDLISIQHSDLRLYRQGSYPPLRGTHLIISETQHILYTRGSVPYYETYAGKYIPSPLEIKLAYYDESPNLICDEIIALTKMNWNNTQFDRKFPITIECARNVGEILKYLDSDDTMQLKYSFYM